MGQRSVDYAAGMYPRVNDSVQPSFRVMSSPVRCNRATMSSQPRSRVAEIVGFRTHAVAAVGIALVKRSSEISLVSTTGILAF